MFENKWCCSVFARSKIQNKLVRFELLALPFVSRSIALMLSW